MGTAKKNHGYLKIGNEADRVTVAAILYKNHYSVSPVRKKKDGKTYEYYVEYETKPREIPDEEFEG